MKLSIGKFAETANVGVETVRFYQRKGLLEVPEEGGGIRRYGEEDLRRLRFIRKGKTAGFTLDEIKELIALDSSHDRLRAQELAMSRIEELESKIAELQQACAALKRLAKQCSDGEPGPCPILKSFGV